MVVDSLNGGFLSGADIVVQGSPVTLQTDSLGRFKIDTLTPGMYQIGVYHARLDTLGLMLATEPFRIGPDSSTILVIAVPSAEAIIHSLCPAQSGANATSAIIGHVNDPETLQPVVGAEVSVAWDEIEVSKKSGIRRTPLTVSGKTNQSGAYVLCGLPSGLRATLQARRGLAVTGEIPITLGNRPTELAGRTLLLSPRDSWREIGNAAVSGVVLLEGSPTNAGSRVELVGTEIVVRTNEQGEFTMRNLPSGSHTLLARHVGFGAEIIPVDLSSRQETRVTIKLPKFVAVMDPVLVTARRMSALDKVGFTQRQKSGFGYFLGPDRLERMHLQNLTDLLGHVPVVFDKCVQYWVDDMVYQELEPGDINLYLAASEIVAAEVYPNLNTPARYMRFGGCSIVVLWTRLKVPAT
ncbi:MAG TPA: carboxypeptidase regulatory-like domain-containing protein [Gemmatimonadaceae bacterium]